MSLPRKRYRPYLEPGGDTAKNPKSTKRQDRVPIHVPDRGTQGDQMALNPTREESTVFPTDHSSASDNQDTSVNSSDSEDSENLGRDISSHQQCQRDDLQGYVYQESGLEIHHSAASAEDCNQPSSSNLPSRNDDWGEINIGVDSIFTSMFTENVCDKVNILSSESLTPEALNKPLVPSLSVTKYETLLMIFHLAMRHGMTGVLLEDMLKYTNTLVGDDNAIPASKYLFHKLFTAGKTLDIHFYCPTCEKYLGPSCAFKEETVDCDKCKSVCTTSSMNNGNFFIALSIKDQLETILKRKDINVVYPVKDRPEQSFSDIFDGQLHKALQNYCQENQLSHPLTLTFKIDGSPVYKSPKNSSLWPIQFFLNEVDRNQRFNVENVLLGGLWFGSSSPIMDVFFKPFVSELKVLRSSGVTWTPSEGGIVQSPVFAMCCVTDSIAKPKVQKHHQFNGRYGCGYCLHPGVDVILNDETGFGNLRFVADDNYPYRADRTLRQHMREASRLPTNAREKHVYGTIGISPISGLPLFNMVFGFGIDWMHTVLEGVMEKLCHLWFSTKNSDQRYFIGDRIGLVDKKMSTLAPPSYRPVVRVISDRVHYKANEWRSFLFFYGLPCLIHILPDKYYKHFRKFATAMHILLRASFTYDEMQEADFLLHDFVGEFGDLYGEKNMVYNVHLLSHCGKIVTMLGPMWAYSAFCFESGNDRLVKLVKGTTGVATQIVTKYHMAATAAELVVEGQYSVSDRIIDFCNDVVSYKVLKNASKIKDTVLLGSKFTLRLSQEEKDLIVSKLALFRDNFVFSFNHVVRNGVIYHAQRHSNQKRNDDSCVKFLDGSYALIDVIFNTGRTEALWCFARRIRLISIEENDRFFPPHIRQACIIDPYDSLGLYSFSLVEKKCVLMNCDKKLYVAEFPNTLEKD